MQGTSGSHEVGDILRTMEVIHESSYGAAKCPQVISSENTMWSTMQCILLITQTTMPDSLPPPNFRVHGMPWIIKEYTMNLSLRF
jgi:hypothetical protein